jgi:hypothetical protein
MRRVLGISAGLLFLVCWIPTQLLMASSKPMPPQRGVSLENLESFRTAEALLHDRAVRYVECSFLHLPNGQDGMWGISVQMEAHVRGGRVLDCSVTIPSVTSGRARSSTTVQPNVKAGAVSGTVNQSYRVTAGKPEIRIIPLYLPGVRSLTRVDTAECLLRIQVVRETEVSSEVRPPLEKANKNQTHVQKSVVLDGVIALRIAGASSYSGSINYTVGADRYHLGTREFRRFLDITPAPRITPARQSPLQEGWRLVGY